MTDSHRSRLPLAPGAPPGTTVSVEGSVECRPHAADGLADYRFKEQTTYDVFIEGLGQAVPRVWVGQEERTSDLRLMGDGAYWPLNWGNYVGTSRLYMKLDGQTVLDLPVEVRSVKLDYLDHYRGLLHELSEWLAALAFSVRTPTALPATLDVRQRGSPYLVYLFLHHLMHPCRLPAYFGLVAAQPHRRLVRETRRVDFAHARNIDGRGLAELVTPAAGLTRARSGLVNPVVTHHLRGYVPTRLLDTRPRTDFDTPENRFVAHLLQELGRQLSDLERAFRQDAGQHPGRAAQAFSLAGDCRRWGRQVADMARASFLADVGPMAVFPASSQVLQRREGYRELRDAYFRLLLSPCVRWEALEDLLQVPNKDLATLYEYWSLFALADVLSQVLGQTPNWSDLLCLQEDVYQVRLHQGSRVRVGIGDIELGYNRSFRHPRSSYSVTLRPDFVVEARDRRLLFDAKYRVSSQDIAVAFDPDAPDEDDSPDQAAPTRTFKRGDLYKMHTYRDAIRDAQAVFILYPGNVFRAFGVDGLHYTEPATLPSDFEGVGALPVLPGRVDNLVACLDSLLGGQDG